MSLADQQWCPTSVQVTVLQARGLRTKGKNGTNDAYAVMQVGKEKYQTSVVEKSVAPVWKEEASFDLPPLHLGGGGGGGGERGTLHVHVLHRALVGPDKQLGQAVINLLQLSEDKTRNKTEWFKLLDKTGKADKDRGEVLVDIQFMRNNMTASMFDLSTAGKSRSRLGKFKDKVRGKKKESDTVSNVVPSFTQVLTDSEDEANGDGEAAAGKDEKKKKHKIKSLFSPKSNLQRNMSQSMSVLPAKNSSLSGSQSSGLNVDSSEGKKKFKFMIHKRSGSSDSKDSSSSQKHGNTDQSNLCINGSHVYCEEPQPRTSRIGSNFSLASSGHGSMEDVPESSPPSVDSLRGVRQYSPWTEEDEEEDAAEGENTTEDVDKLRREEEERMREEEERRRKEEEEEEERVRRQEEALERLAEEKKRQDEEERKRIEKEEEEERIQKEEEQKRQEEEERIRREEEELEKLAEEEKRRMEEEEKRQREEEERIRVEKEKAEEDRRRQEEERLRREEEEHKLAEQKRRLEEDRRRIEEENIRKEEEEKLRREEERRRKDEEERVRREEEEREERRRVEEEERIRKEEEQRREEEERAKKEKEEYERLMEEKRKQEEKETEEKIRREEEKRIRMEQERRRMEEEEAERARREEEHRLAEEKRRLEEERQRIEEEKVRQEEEERRRKEEEERIRREEEEHEEKKRLEEQERERREEEKRQREEEERIRKEEVRRQEEEERARKEREEYERLVEEKRRQEEEKRKQKEEEERIRKEEQERIEEEERRRREEEERARKEREEHERLVEEKRRQEEEKRKQKEEEERIRKEEQERMEEEERKRREEEERAKKEEMERLAEDKRKVEQQEKRRIEKEKLARDAEERKRRETKTLRPADIIFTNPFDEDFSNNPFEEIPDSPSAPESNTTKTSTVQQSCESAVSSARSKKVPTDEKDLISAQREKRPAPQPPGRNQAESQREQDLAAWHLNKQSNDKDIKTASVLPQRSAQTSKSLADAKSTQGVLQSSSTNGTASIAKHGKRQAPSRPRSVEEEPSSEPKLHNMSQRGGSEAKQAPVVYGLNPFEDDEDELTVYEDTKPSGGSIQWPPTSDKDAASQAKLKSAKMARAPPPPAKTDATSSTLIHQNTDGGYVKAVSDDSIQTGDLQTEAMMPGQGTEPQPARAQEAPPTASRRLQPVKPLNPLDEQSGSIVQGESCKQSTGIRNEVQVKAKVNDTGLKGPYSQLTQEELISLVLKQEKQLSERDRKISELEQYIDNLLVRVMEEQPSILMSMSSMKA
ncbi:hypothetical protein INR49_015241 [Caranx melampygus]|nr:hypothetical protein INR49_015241 [Caranx melampygus]